ncbi:unnamed protein product, partial [Didymodactylos carnosus]
YTIDDLAFAYYDDDTTTNAELTPTTAAILSFQEKLTIMFAQINMTTVLTKQAIETLLSNGRRKRASAKAPTKQSATQCVVGPGQRRKRRAVTTSDNSTDLNCQQLCSNHNVQEIIKLLDNAINSTQSNVLDEYRVDCGLVPQGGALVNMTFTSYSRNITVTMGNREFIRRIAGGGFI